MIDTPPIWDSPKLGTFPERLMTKTRLESHRERLFIPVHTFEVLDFPVQVRLREYLGNEVASPERRYITGANLPADGGYAP